MPVIAPPAADYHFSIGAKVLLLFLGLALAATGSLLVVYRAQKLMEGTATEINRYGSLRYLSQQTQLALEKVAHDGNPGTVERLIGEYEATLDSLRQSKVGGEIGGEQARRILATMDTDWLIYLDGVRRFIQSHTPGAAYRDQLDRLGAQSEHLLTQANRATWALSEGISRLQQRTREHLLRIFLVTAAILAFTFLYFRKRIVMPLRDLAGVTLRFAAGEHGARSGFRSHDEIGRLAKSFDYMAAETERHIAQIATDLDDIRRQEAELRKLTQAVEHSPASVVITNAEGIIGYVNPRFSEVTGYTAAEVLGHTPALLKSGFTLPENYGDMWRTLKSGGVWRGELLNRRKGGELFWESTQISSVRDAAGEITHFVAVKEDITARKHAEQALAMLNIELEQHVAARTRQLEAANRELQAFSHSVSHDLRTPLRAIRGFAEAIAEEGSERLNGELADYLQRIQAAAERMGEMIDELLELGRVGQIEMMRQPVNLGRMAREILAGLARAEPERRVNTEVADDILVDGDPRLLRIALAHLLGNAWKFSAGRDPARIVFGPAEAAGENQDKTVLMVSDNGAGFSMDHADKLFHPFQRLHAAERFAGAGIGLAMVKRVIELHGGRIWADAAPEQGATFRFELPESPPDAESFLLDGREGRPVAGSPP